MNPPFDVHAPKKRPNVCINRDLLAKAKELKINLFATLEAALTELVNARQREVLQKENRAAIETYNHLVEEHGVFGDDSRSFSWAGSMPIRPRALQQRKPIPTY